MQPKSIFSPNLGSPHRRVPSDGGSPNHQSPMSGAGSPPIPKPAVLKTLKGMDLRIQSTFERNMDGSFRSHGSSMDTTSSSGDDTTGSRSDLFGATAPEDMANDAALGAFLAATNAAARNRRQRAAEEMLPRSQQLLNQQATRRNRRMSSDSAVCETRPMVDALQTGDLKAKREAAKAIRTALKDGAENRMRLVGSGGVRPLVLALKSTDNETVEHAAAAILFLCLSRDTTGEVISSGAVALLIEAVGRDDPLAEAARSNAAATLFALTQKEDGRKLVHTHGAIKPLVALLKAAKTQRGKKDACLGLFNMAMMPKAPEELVELGVVERTVELLEEAEEGVEEKAAALMGALSKSPAGLKVIYEEEDALYALADTLEGGSTAAAEHAVVTLHQLAATHPSIVPKILAEGCLPPLVRLASQSKKGSDSRLLLEILRSHCKRKAKEEAKKQEALRPLSRLSNSQSYHDGPGRTSMVDRESLMKAWSGEAAAVS